MKISFELTIDDWMAFQKHYLSTSKQFKQTKIFVIMMVPVILLIFSLFQYFKGEFNYYTIAIYIIISLFWFFFYPKQFDKSCLKKTKKMLEEGNNSALLGIHNIEFNDDYFFVKEPGSEYKTNWSAINKVEENDKYIFIYITSVSACIIPKFKIGDKKEKIVEFIKKKTS
jgi:hypothetical protein